MIYPATNSRNHYISSDYLVSFKDFCLSSGIDLFSELATTKNGEKLSEQLLSPPTYIALKTLFQIYQHVAAISERPLSLAWEFAQWQSAKNAHGTLGLAIRNARDFVQSAELMMRFGRLRTNLSTLTLSTEDDKLFFSIKEENIDSLKPSKEILQFILSSYLFNAESFLRKSLPETKREYQTCIYLKTRIENKELPVNGNFLKIQDECTVNTLSIPLSIAKTQFTTHNPNVLDRLVSILEKEIQSLPQQSLQGRLRELIRRSDWNEISIEGFSDKLNISVSTLQRRLREEGVTFYDLKHQERVKAAKDLLLFSSHTLQDISDILGYSNTSNFTKSFKTSENCSPQSFRNNHRLSP